MVLFPHLLHIEYILASNTPQTHVAGSHYLDGQFFAVSPSAPSPFYEEACHPLYVALPPSAPDAEEGMEGVPNSPPRHGNAEEGMEGVPNPPPRCGSSFSRSIPSLAVSNNIPPPVEMNARELLGLKAVLTENIKNSANNLIIKWRPSLNTEQVAFLAMISGILLAEFILLPLNLCWPSLHVLLGSFNLPFVVMVVAISTFFLYAVLKFDAKEQAQENAQNAIDFKESLRTAVNANLSSFYLQKIGNFRLNQLIEKIYSDLISSRSNNDSRRRDFHIVEEQECEKISLAHSQQFVDEILVLMHSA